MWLLAARVADRASKQLRTRKGVLQLCAMVTTHAPPAAPDKLQMYVDTVTITDGVQNNGASKVVNSKQVYERHLMLVIDLVCSGVASFTSDVFFVSRDALQSLKCELTTSTSFRALTPLSDLSPTVNTGVREGVQSAD